VRGVVSAARGSESERRLGVDARAGVWRGALQALGQFFDSGSVKDGLTISPPHPAPARKNSRGKVNKKTARWSGRFRLANFSLIVVGGGYRLAPKPRYACCEG
jgi:hypothetical protein